ncbi:TRAP transporter substrate-binding protein [Bradyrhizobium sp.]|uniref:TRAP transporter substrate-binding protein n=1 Tax=Bradyrhizobium sp. TaxID=376 RepID=UPI003C577900
MQFLKAKKLVCAVVAAGALGLGAVLPSGQAQAQQQTYLMKISTPTVHDIPNVWIDGYAAMLEKDSGGRIKVQVFPASQLGSIPRQIEGTQFGSIQCVQIPPEFMVGLDARFQLLAAPGLVDSEIEGQRLVANPAVRKLMLGLGADKGLHGLSVWYATPNVLISRTPLHDVADFKGKKVRVFASPFQTVAFERLGITPVAMSLGDVLPALQQGAIDGSITGIGPIVKFHMIDAAKYVTEINQPSIFIIEEVNQKWYEALPKDLQQLVDSDAAKEDAAIAPMAGKMADEYLQEWKAAGGTLIKLSPAEHAKMMKILAGVGTEVSSKTPTLAVAYKIVSQAAKHAAASK